MALALAAVACTVPPTTVKPATSEGTAAVPGRKIASTKSSASPTTATPTATPTPSASPTATATPEAQASGSPTPTPAAPSPTPSPTPTATPTPEPAPTGEPGFRLMDTSPQTSKVYAKLGAGGTVSALTFTPSAGEVVIKIGVVGEPLVIAKATCTIVDKSVEPDADEYRLLQADDEDPGSEPPEGAPPGDGAPPEETPGPTPDPAETPTPEDPLPSNLPTAAPSDPSTFEIQAAELGLGVTMPAGIHRATIKLDRPELRRYVQLDREPRLLYMDITFKDAAGVVLTATGGKPLVTRVQLNLM